MHFVLVVLSLTVNIPKTNMGENTKQFSLLSNDLITSKC